MPTTRSAEDNKGGRPRTLTQPGKTTMYLPSDLKARINAARGQVPLAAWIREAIEQRLAREARDS